MCLSKAYVFVASPWIAWRVAVNVYNGPATVKSRSVKSIREVARSGRTPCGNQPNQLARKSGWGPRSGPQHLFRATSWADFRAKSGPDEQLF